MYFEESITDNGGMGFVGTESAKGTRVGNAWKLSWDMFKTDKDFLTYPRYAGYFNSYFYRLLLDYVLPFDFFTSYFWR
jgi:hypothetical protein